MTSLPRACVVAAKHMAAMFGQIQLLVGLQGPEKRQERGEKEKVSVLEK